MKTNNKPTMLTYIKETPEQIEKNIQNRKALTKTMVDLYTAKEYDTIWIIASGSSSNGSSCAKPFMMKYLNCDVKIVTPSTFNFGEDKLKENDFAMVISQSGCSTNSIDALKKLKTMGYNPIGITGNANSDFKDYADPMIDYGVGVESVGYVTKGVTTLAEFLMLFALEAALATKKIETNVYDSVLEEMKKTPVYHKQMQEQTNAFYKLHRKALTAMSVCYSVGFSQGLGIANESALKIGETVQIPSFVYEAEEYIHGPNLQLTPNYTILLIDDLDQGSDRLLEIYKATRYVSDRAFLVSTRKEDDHTLHIPFEVKEPLLSPLYVLPCFQLFAYYITEELNRWEKHPLYNDFNEHISLKTDTIKDIMPESNSAKKVV
ncbi:glucoselysine-6-phosphate deglycase [Breznakia sp. PF5-3]|uniref:SIS domain-containing protein n=1 Tax=unclassified Breznakia TaxID=2623764 RepID=UPI00240503AE|nr:MULTISPECIES: SIS domain-containing protein [unclassified Breznakia]MDF9824764.1 glucoselysine-6-phosphate deglycase [Breznakia sp. PM6-1]MDF9835669.1 glucoselysine-6-phosphate deglycase [Breznakia sp. PF5-3]MDF9837718.1 glucoselysine-6-phosphate deglycase [Breznakia sp. PFB2-8]MDF9859679.1 glucoselysine-6-phosphate deglycase [Breznakia sp. PH5-24]